MSLRAFHLVFILLVVIGADMFGAWAVYDYGTSHNRLTLGMGILSFVGGFGLIAYAYWFVRKTERAHIR